MQWSAPFRRWGVNTPKPNCPPAWWAWHQSLRVTRVQGVNTEDVFTCISKRAMVVSASGTTWIHGSSQSGYRPSTMSPSEHLTKRRYPTLSAMEVSLGMRGISSRPQRSSKSCRIWAVSSCKCLGTNIRWPLMSAPVLTWVAYKMWMVTYKTSSAQSLEIGMNYSKGKEFFRL